MCATAGEIVPPEHALLTAADPVSRAIYFILQAYAADGMSTATSAVTDGRAPAVPPATSASTEHTPAHTHTHTHTHADDEDADAAPYRPAASRAGRKHAASTRCPYLDTINRAVLDFDMPKICSVTLSHTHVYACLVCGKFFEGRGKHTPAYTHSVQDLHHVFINLHDGRVWCLPDMYEVVDASLRDITYALTPTYTRDDIATVDANTRLSRDVLGVAYLPGFMGLNNLNHTDGINAVVQALAHVPPVRDFFLDTRVHTHAHAESRLLQTFGALVRRMWSPASFKATAAPVEFVNELSIASKKKFGAGAAVDVVEFMSWLLNALHADLTADTAAEKATAAAAAADAQHASTIGAAARAGAKRTRPDEGAGKASRAAARRSAITDAFQGEVEVELVSSELQEAEAAERAAAAVKPDGKAAGGEEDGDDGDVAVTTRKQARPAVPAAAAPRTPSKQRLPFLFLSLDLPPAPLFKDNEGAMVISQIPVYTLLEKFNGELVTDSLRGQYRERKRYRITRLPPYLVCAVKRFRRNIFFTEKNPTIINFPVRNLDMRPYFHPDAGSIAASLPAAESLSSMSVSELNSLLKRIRADTGVTIEAPVAPVEKAELVAAARAAVTNASGTKYDLIANIVHDSPPETSGAARSGAMDPLEHGSYRVHVQHAATGTWYEIADLRVSETLPQLIGVSESNVMIFQRQRPTSSVRAPVTSPAHAAASTKA